MPRNAIRLSWDGVKDSRDFFNQLPKALHQRGSEIILAAVTAAYNDVKAAYQTKQKTKTGNLINGLTIYVEPSGSRFGLQAKLKNRAPHAHFIERGTKRRVTRTIYEGVLHPHRHTAPHEPGESRGRVPKGDYFVRTVQLHRARMFYQLGRMLREQGLRVDVDQQIRKPIARAA